jgi:hypothetical protein
MKKQLSYKEKLMDPRWQRMRLEVMQRDGFACLCCGDSQSTLNIHHKSYKNNPWESCIDDLETLCEECHKYRTELNNKFQSLDTFIALTFMDKIIKMKTSDLIKTNYLLNLNLLKHSEQETQYNGQRSIDPKELDLISEEHLKSIRIREQSFRRGFSHGYNAAINDVIAKRGINKMLDHFNNIIMEWSYFKRNVGALSPSMSIDGTGE